MRFRLSVVAVCAALITACGGSDSTTAPPSSGGTPSTPQTPSTPSSPVSTNAVGVDNDFFTPANIQVSPGTTVTWTWAGGVTHNVTFSDGGTNSGDRSSGSFSRTFGTTGTFNYRCTLHAGMDGSVLVK